MPTIKRYPNRKLYDTQAKRYVTLDEIAGMIRQGQDVEVIDHETGKDITSLILSQIILGQERRRSGFLPRSLMTSLIRAGGDTLEFFLRSLQQTLNLAPDHVEERLRSLVDRGILSPEQAQEVIRALELPPRDRAQDENLAQLLQRLNIPTQEDVAQLQVKLAELSRQLAALADELDDPR